MAGEVRRGADVGSPGPDRAVWPAWDLSFKMPCSGLQPCRLPRRRWIMAVLPDGESGLLKATLDRARSGEGGRFQEERRTVKAVTWRMRTGAPWRALPPEFGPWRAPAICTSAGSGRAVGPAAGGPARGGPTRSGRGVLDGSSIRARQKAVGAKRGPAERARPEPGRLWHKGPCGLRRPTPAVRLRLAARPGV